MLFAALIVINASYGPSAWSLDHLIERRYPGWARFAEFRRIPTTPAGRSPTAASEGHAPSARGDRRANFFPWRSRAGTRRPVGRVSGLDRPQFRGALPLLPSAGCRPWRNRP